MLFDLSVWQECRRGFTIDDPISKPRLPLVERRVVVRSGVQLVQSREERRTSKREQVSRIGRLGYLRSERLVAKSHALVSVQNVSRNHLTCC